MSTWKRRVAVHPEFHDPGLEFAARRDAIVAKLRASGWPDLNSDVGELVDELATTTTPEEFDEVWSAIYDEADADYLRSAIGLIWRALVLVAVFLLLMTFAHWLGN